MQNSVIYKKVNGSYATKNDIEDVYGAVSFAFHFSNDGTFNIVAISQESPAILKAKLLIDDVDFYGVDCTQGFKRDEYMEVL